MATERIELPERLDEGSTRSVEGRLTAGGSRTVVLDARRVGAMDSVSTARLLRLVSEGRRAGVAVRLSGISDEARRRLERLDPAVVEDPPESVPSPALERIGRATLDAFNATNDVATLARETAVGGISRGGIRWDRTLAEIAETGARAVGIVVFISLLIGVVLALNGALQLRQFGAAIFVANLVAISMTREMGPIVTAVIVSGRTGSAIAAELGTMVVSEEIDAMRTMAISPVRFLVVPKVLALLVVMPLLTTLSIAAGIGGGYVVGTVGLDLGSTAYLSQTVQALFVSDVLAGLVKSVVFAGIIGLTGAHRGLSVPFEPAAVGRAATSAVVTSIVLCIVANAVFTAVFYVTG